MHMLKLEEHWFTHELSRISHEKLMMHVIQCDNNSSKSLHAARKWLRAISNFSHKNKQENNKSCIYYHIIVCNNEPEITI